MGKYLLSYACFFLVLCSCKNQTSNDNSSNTNVVQDFIKTFEGKIGDKYDIMMKLNSVSGKISGFYFYKNQGIDIKVEGQIGSDGQFSINEFDKGGNATGVFKGQVSGTRLDGTWSKPNGEKSSSFSAIESNSLYESAKREAGEQKYSNISGMYRPLQGDGTSDGSLEVKYIGNNQFQFSLTIVGIKECTGEVSGIGKIFNGIGKYSEGDCSLLTFKFSDSSVLIEEESCQLHGVSCSFDGKYSKE